MKLARQSTLNQKTEVDKQLPILQNDINKLYLCLQGRVRFGRGSDGDRGENMAGEFQQFTTSGTPNAENTIAHTIGAIPVGYIIVWQDKAGTLYQGPTTGTAWTSTNIYLKCSVASVTFSVFLIQ